jgi:hypothetical protein
VKPSTFYWWNHIRNSGTQIFLTLLTTTHSTVEHNMQFPEPFSSHSYIHLYFSHFSSLGYQCLTSDIITHLPLSFWAVHFWLLFCHCTSIDLASFVTLLGSSVLTLHTIWSKEIYDDWTQPPLQPMAYIFFQLIKTWIFPTTQPISSSPLTKLYFTHSLKYCKDWFSN